MTVEVFWDHLQLFARRGDDPARCVCDLHRCQSRAKETYYIAKKTYYVAKETYVRFTAVNRGTTSIFFLCLLSFCYDTATVRDVCE